MTLGAKSLTIPLVLVLIILPAVALASCSNGMARMSESDMAGMIMPPAGTFVSEKASISCCVFAPAEITSSWLPQDDSAATVVDIGFIFRHDLKQVEEASTAPTYLAATPPTQASLCVFLI